jgi:hypothetical protein
MKTAGMFSAQCFACTYRNLIARHYCGGKALIADWHGGAQGHGGGHCHNAWMQHCGAMGVIYFTQMSDARIAERRR